MRIELNEQRRSVRVESRGTVVLDVEDFPVALLKEQLRAWISSADDTTAPAFAFRSENAELDGIFRIEPRPAMWQFTSSREKVRSSELLSLEEWQNVLRQSGV